MHNIEVHCIGWPADSQLKSHTKKHSESENNAVGHTTFLVQPACWLGPNYNSNTYKHHSIH